MEVHPYEVAALSDDAKRVACAEPELITEPVSNKVFRKQFGPPTRQQGEDSKSNYRSDDEDDPVPSGHHCRQYTPLGLPLLARTW